MLNGCTHLHLGYAKQILRSASKTRQICSMRSLIASWRSSKASAATPMSYLLKPIASTPKTEIPMADNTQDPKTPTKPAAVANPSKMPAWVWAGLGVGVIVAIGYYMAATRRYA